jgi:hypothetical protein
MRSGLYTKENPFSPRIERTTSRRALVPVSDMPERNQDHRTSEKDSNRDLSTAAYVDFPNFFAKDLQRILTFSLACETRALKLRGDSSRWARR